MDELFEVKDMIKGPLFSTRRKVWSWQDSINLHELDMFKL